MVPTCSHSKKKWAEEGGIGSQTEIMNTTEIKCCCSLCGSQVTQWLNNATGLRQPCPCVCNNCSLSLGWLCSWLVTFFGRYIMLLAYLMSWGLWPDFALLCSHIKTWTNSWVCMLSLYRGMLIFVSLQFQYMWWSCDHGKMNLVVQ